MLTPGACGVEGVVKDLTVTRGVLWARLNVVDTRGNACLLKGLSNGEAADLLEWLRSVYETPAQKQWLRSVCLWVRRVRVRVRESIKHHGWIERELIETLAAEQPSPLINIQTRTAFVGLDTLDSPSLPIDLPDPLTSESDLASQTPTSYIPLLKATQRFPDALNWEAFVGSLNCGQLQALCLWTQPLETLFHEENKRCMQKAFLESERFFDTVEKCPLTREQREAVISSDNRMLLVAAAGSGKTSVIVAKTGYVLTQGFFDPEKLLILAFNTDAAEEVAARLVQRLKPFVPNVDRVKVKTFHALALQTIGLATGKKPSAPSWIVEDRKAIDKLVEIINSLCETSSEFRKNWNLFCHVLADELPSLEEDSDNPDVCDSTTGRVGFSTAKGDLVKSRSEAVLADWLHCHGIEYRYEEPYPIDTRDSMHSQYRPDFYLPAANAYLELYAVDQNGRSPFGDAYLESMKWKEALHRQHKTTLLSVTVHAIRTGEAFEYLTRELPKRGVRLGSALEKALSSRNLTKKEAVILRTFRTFLTHMKNNRLTAQDVQVRLQEVEVSSFKLRHRIFLSLFDAVRTRWDAELKAEGGVDFEDMLNQAANILQAGRWKSPYEMVLVDEFQDASQARARLVNELVREKGRFLFAVGDDWQSINRFAGADVGVMQSFETLFGKGTVLTLETTFRCPQTLCDIAGGFVSKNPAQLNKRVRSQAQNTALPVVLLAVKREDGIASAVASYIASLPLGSHGKRRVLILGRYRFERQILSVLSVDSMTEVRFSTVHAAKGLEADYIVIPRLIAGTMGFPCRIHEDPVLRLAMPTADTYELSEERRLFYVALTRAKKQVCLVTVEGNTSVFVTELIDEFGIKVRTSSGQMAESVCPRCGKGFLVPRKGPYGSFWGCSCYPNCHFTRPL